LLATEGKFERIDPLVQVAGMVIWVTEAKALPVSRIWLRFSDSSEGVVDLRDFIQSDHREIVRQLEDPVVFRNFSVDNDTVVWANGFDLAPEFLWAWLNTTTRA
jgi:hypothetical protein